jgi:hypothetical protein
MITALAQDDGYGRWEAAGVILPGHSSAIKITVCELDTGVLLPVSV